MIYKFIGTSLSVLLIAGCAPYSVPLASIPARQIETQKITVGSAQSLKVGMSGADVINALGSPNIITSDSAGGETWIYEKISKEFEFMTAQDGSWLFSPRSQLSGVSSSTERTLIVVVVLDANRKLQRITYRQMTF
jgi:outer membrane protein assembly factor BamE (lipoprotein component of BamABCDE complex)